MRVLYVTDRLSVRGGADNHLRQVAEAVIGWGANARIAVGRTDDGLAPPIGAEVTRIRCLSSLVDSSADLQLLESEVSNADIVHVQNVMNPTALSLATSTGRAIVTVQDHRFFCPGAGKTLPDRTACGHQMSERSCSSCIDDDQYRSATLDLTRRRQEALGDAHLVVLSRYMRDELIDAGLDSPAVLPPWISCDSGPIDPGTGFVLGGRLVRHKDVLNAAKAWHAAGTTHPLLVAGEGPLEDDLEGARLLGWLSSEDLKRLLRSARALLFPSFWQEPLGILGIESLAVGTPVIVADSGGTCDWSKAGCLTTPPGDARAMAAAMRQLGADPDLALALGTAGRRAVRESFSEAVIEPRLRELYSRVGEPSA